MKQTLAAFLFFSIALFSCKTKEKTPSQGIVLAFDKQRVDFDFLFYNANKEKILGNYELALELFLKCLKQQPDHAAANYEVAMIFASLNDNKQALEYSRKAAEKDPSNSWYQILYGECLLKDRKYGEAVRVYDKMLKQNPERIDAYYDLATAQMYAGKTEDAIKTYNTLESLIGVTEEISAQKARLYQSIGKTDKAVKEITNLITLNPMESKYYGMLGEIYQQSGMKEKALDAYNEIVKMDPSNPMVHLSLADYYRSVKDYDKSFEEIKLAFQNKGLDIDAKVQILLSYFNLSETDQKMRTQGMELCRILVETHPGEAKAFSIYGDFLYREKKMTEARDAFRSALALDKERYPIWNQVLVIDLDQNDFQSLYEESKQAMELFPNQPLVYLFHGIACSRLQKYPEAADVLTKGKAYVIENPALLSEFYANIGEARHQEKRYAASDSAFTEALNIDSLNATVLNNYSYYLSLRKERLPDAERMSKRSNEIEVNNHSFQDTYGWILYQQGKYTEAKKWIEKAVLNGGNNDVILEHLGDVLYKLGDLDQAYEKWQEARSKGPGSEWLDKKIETKKLYE